MRSLERVPHSLTKVAADTANADQAVGQKWAARWGGADGPVGSTVGGSAFEPGKGLGVALIVLSILDRMESISHPTGTIELA